MKGATFPDLFLGNLNRFYPMCTQGNFAEGCAPSYKDLSGF